MPASFSVQKLFSLGKSYLSSKSLPNFEREALWLVEHAFGCSKERFYLENPLIFNKEKVKHFFSLLRRRAKREPLAYILGEWEFFGLSLSLGEGCLIPRADTETLVQAFFEVTKLGVPLPLRVLELGVGCGTLPLACCKEEGFVKKEGTEEHVERESTEEQAKKRPAEKSPPSKTPEEKHWVGVELSLSALEHAKKNQERHKKRLREGRMLLSLVGGKGLEMFSSEKNFSLVVSNPPYIPTEELASLSQEVQKEPKLALDGGKDGLDFYRYLLEKAKVLLLPGGGLLVELGKGQAQALEGMAQELLPKWRVFFWKDLLGEKRVCFLQSPFS